MRRDVILLSWLCTLTSSQGETVKKSFRVLWCLPASTAQRLMEEYWLVAIAVVALEKLLNWGFVKQKKKGVNSCFHSCGVGSKASLIGYQPPGCSALVQYGPYCPMRSEEHTSELQSQFHLVC